MKTKSHPEPPGMLGVRLVLGDREWPQHWEATADLEALRLPDQEFLPAGTLQEALGLLEGRFPSPLAEAGRIQLVEGSYNHQLGRKGNPALLVHELPFLRALAGGRDDLKAIADLETWTSEYGPLLITDDWEFHLREHRDFDDSDLVIARYEHHGGYRALKFAPGKARARRTGRTNVRKKEQAARDRRSAIDAMEGALGDAARSVYRELCCLESEDLVSALRDYYSGGLIGAAALSWLRALLLIRRKFIRGRSYRTSPEFQKLWKTYQELPAGLTGQDWGLYPESDNQQLWDAEYKARPRARKPPKEPAPCPKPDPAS